MLAIRFFRTGKKNQPSFKIVVTKKTNSSTRGRFVEQIGTYNPLTKEKTLNVERAKYWVGVGAQPSETVHNLLVSEKVLDAKKKDLHKKSKKEQPVAEVAPEQPAEVKAEEKPVEAPVEKPTEPEKPAEPDKAPQGEQKPEEAQKTE